MKKQIVLLIALIQIGCLPVVNAQTERPTYLVRLYEDNDFLNDKGKGTDRAYSNGTRLDFFYTKTHKSRLFLDRWMPKAGDSSINEFGVGFTHIIYTQSDILKDYYMPHDYNWSGGMYLTHTLYSYNPKKKYDFQTEVLVGVIGPASLDESFQKTFHHIIGDPAVPVGWDNQFKNDVLLNVNFTAEKQIAQISDFFMLMGSAQVQAGTMADAVDLAPEVRIGKMAPYFNGLNAQRSGGSKKNNKLQAYLRFKPGVQFVAWNSMVEGGMFSEMPVEKMYDGPETQGEMNRRISRPQIEHMVTYVSYGFVIVYGSFSASYNQTHTSELVKDTYQHTYGNITLTYGW